MPIMTRDRKLLWARAGGVCILCKSCLTECAKGGGRDVVLGEEAHIVSEEPNGPRFRPMPAKEVDTYNNLLLLCPSDHRVIDEQVTYYNEERLHVLKREHEQWVQYHFSPTPAPLKVRNPEANKPVALRPIETGKELMNIASHKWDDIVLNGYIQAEFSMTEEIAQLREAGLVVYAAARSHNLEGGAGAPSPWLVAYVVIRRSDDTSYP